MSDEHIIRNCAPTLAGIKTGSLFTCNYTSKDALMADIRHLNRRLRAKGLRVLPLRFSKKRVLIYMFRPKKLSADLSNTTAARLLEQQGYCTQSCDRCVARLIQKIRLDEDFPHEIGLFLGYPPQDVCGFIKKDVCKYVGYWKVYADEAAAKKKFAQYDKCTRLYFEQWAKGKDIEKLTVAC